MTKSGYVADDSLRRPFHLPHFQKPASLAVRRARGKLDMSVPATILEKKTNESERPIQEGAEAPHGRREPV